MNTFFELRVGDEPTWHLELENNCPDGTSVDAWRYKGCQWIEDPRPVPFRLQVDGQRVDYYLTAFLATVVSTRLADVLATVAPADIQRIPAVVAGDYGKWEVINVLPCIDCIDAHKSVIQYYPSSHPERPGKPRGVVKLAIDPSRTQGHQILHPKGWEVARIISDQVKSALEHARFTGMEFIPVIVER